MTKTEQNLLAAFSGESMARNKYTFYAKVAKKEGFHYIAKLFEETAANEMRHAKDIYTLLNGTHDTASNLQAAIEGENYEATEMYVQFAKEAEEEGNREAMILFKMLAKIEAHHRDRFQKLAEMVKAGTVYKREEPINWKCEVCGYIYHGKEPPKICPCCKHPQEHFEPADLDI